MKKLLTVIALGLASFAANAEDAVVESYKSVNIDVATLHTEQQAQLKSDKENFLWALEVENEQRMEAILANR